MGFAFNGLSGAAVAVSGTVATEVSPLSASKTYKCGTYSDQTVVANTPQTMYTVTAGKTLYITTLSIFAWGGAAIAVGDALSGNAVPADGNKADNKIVITCGASIGYVYHFPTPLKITTTLDMEANGVTGGIISWVGWEQ